MGRYLVVVWRILAGRRCRFSFGQRKQRESSGPSHAASVTSNDTDDVCFYSAVGSMILLTARHTDDPNIDSQDYFV